MVMETVLDVHAAIGEAVAGPADERTLCCIEVEAPALHRYCSNTQSNSTRAGHGGASSSGNMLCVVNDRSIGAVAARSR